MKVLSHHGPLEQLHRLSVLPHTDTVRNTSRRRRYPAFLPPFLIAIRPNQNVSYQLPI